MKKESRTDCEKVDALLDEDIDIGGIPPLDEEFIVTAELRLPRKKIPVTMRIDPDVLVWYKSFGKGFIPNSNECGITHLHGSISQTYAISIIMYLMV